MGGGFAGSAAALLLKRARPGTRIVIVDDARDAGRKVGESCVEMSSWFLTQVLGLDRHLALEHLPKYGLRFWFSNDTVSGLADASELGNRYQTRIPGFHVERARLDEFVLKQAEAEGIDVRRPARVDDVDVGALTLRDGTIRARWVVDASGRQARLARKLDLFRPMPEHPVRASWAYYRNVGPFDDVDRLPGVRCSRGLSTNHLTGYGWWCWMIPLPDGEMSIGTVWDERLTDEPDWAAQPVARAVLNGAECVSAKKHALKHLPYRVERVMGPGWAAVGDAAGFLDPLYSPGLDYAAMTITRATEIIARSLDGEDVAREIDAHNEHFARGFTRWFEALYRDKYHYVGDFELMRIALRLDVAGYYFGVVRPAYRGKPEVSFGNPLGLPFYLFMRFLNRRLARLGEKRRKLGLRNNAGKRDLLPGFTLGFWTLRYFPWALAAWLKIELKTRLAYLVRGSSRASPRSSST